MPKPRGRGHIKGPEQAFIEQFARDVAKRLSPEAAQRLTSLPIPERAKLLKQLEAIIDRRVRARGAA